MYALYFGSILDDWTSLHIPMSNQAFSISSNFQGCFEEFTDSLDYIECARGELANSLPSGDVGFVAVVPCIAPPSKLRTEELFHIAVFFQRIKSTKEY